MRDDQTGRGLRPSAAIALALACAVSVVAPAIASATTVSADRACYRPGQSGLISGEGYTPNGDVALVFTVVGANEGGGVSILTTTADAAGAIEMHVITPSLPLSESPAMVFLSASDQEEAQQGSPPPGTTRWQIATFNASVYPWSTGVGKPGRRALYRMSGFNNAPGQTLYAHYLFRGRLHRTVAVGRLKGPCGTMARRAPQFPFRPVRAGTWSIKVDTSRRYPNRSRGRMYRNVRVRPPDALR